MVETMQFRDFIFPHNPGSITVTQPGELAVHLCPGKGEVVQYLGARAKTVRCQGSFFGATFHEAVSQLQEFRERAGTAERGLLLIPGMQPFLAYLRELSFDSTGDGKIIPYTMVFVEAVAE